MSQRQVLLHGDAASDKFKAKWTGDPLTIGGNIWNSPNYFKVLHSALPGIENRSMFLESSDGESFAHIPLLEVTSEYGKIWNSLPFFGSHGGVSGNDAALELELIRRLSSRLKEGDVASCTVIENPWLRGVNTLHFGITDERRGQVTDLRPFTGCTDEQFMSMVHPKTRTSIRRFRESGLRISRDSGRMPDLFRLHEITMKRIGGRGKPRSFFNAIVDSFREGLDYDLWLATEENSVESALLVLYGGESAEYFVPASSDKGRDRFAMFGLVREAMAHAADLGFNIWNWGGTWWSQHGVYRFKSRWSAQDFYYRYHTFVDEDFSPTDGTLATVGESSQYFYVGALKR